MHCPSYPPWRVHSNYTLQGVQVVMLPIMQFFPFLLSWHPSLVQIFLAPGSQTPAGRIIIVYILIFTFLNRTWETPPRQSLLAAACLTTQLGIAWLQSSFKKLFLILKTPVSHDYTSQITITHRLVLCQCLYCSAW
jgi:hypothetical protein